MQLFILSQGGSKLGKKIYVNCGGRPSFIRGYGSLSTGGSWIKVDGINDAVGNENVFSLKPGGNAVVDDVCEITDYGFVLGSNATYVDLANLRIIIEAYIEGETAFKRVRSVTLNDAKIGVGVDVWTDPTKSYAYADGDEDLYDWIRKAA